MKTYENEQMFVTTFCKDCKESLKNGQNFEAEINGINVIVTSMDNNNASKVTVYTGTVGGKDFKGSITALKKQLNVSYKKEYKRAVEGSTKVTIKSDDELSATAKTAAERIKNAVNVIKRASMQYGLSRADMLERPESVESLILETLKKQRDKVSAAKAEREAKATAEAKAKAEAKRAELQKQLKALQKQLAAMQ